jgi:hypothetical protein
MPYFFQTPRRFTRLLFAVSLLIASAQLHAQRARITQPVDDTARVTLRGSLRPLAQAEFDRGQVSDSDSTGTLLLVLGRSAEQQAALDNYVKSASMPGTALFRQWLLPTEYGIRFGASPDDIATVRTWLESNGFTIEQVSPAANVIRFSGNMGAVRTAFHTEIHQYEVNGELHLANGSAPSIPAALAPVVRGIAALNDFYPWRTRHFFY